MPAATLATQHSDLVQCVMSASLDGAPAVRFGLTHFDAVDTSGQPKLEDDEELAGSYSDISLKLGDDTDVGAGTLYITTT